MTRNTQLPHAFLIGFEQLFNHLDAKRPSFPPCDIEIIDKESGSVRITAAVAGYTLDNISITQKDDMLVIEGAQKRDENKIYQIEGIAKRNFKLEFGLHQYAVVKNAKLEHGLLAIDIDLEIPEDKKPRSIAINA